MSIKVGDREASGGLAQLADEENLLLSEKQRLLVIMDELESRLASEIKRKKSAVNSLQVEVSELQNMCEELARTLGIPVKR